MSYFTVVPIFYALRTAKIITLVLFVVDGNHNFTVT